MLDQHPDAPSSFEPTHVVTCDGRIDFVRLEVEQPVSWAYRPGESDPAFAITARGLWQDLDHAARVTARPITYRASYKPPSKHQGHVYFVQAGEGGPIKIGWSQDVAQRIAGLQTAQAEPLRLLGTLPGTRLDEARVHRVLDHHRLRGEWFHPHAEVIRFPTRKQAS